MATQAVEVRGTYVEPERKSWPEIFDRFVPRREVGISADSNQRATKERIIQQRMEANPALDVWEAEESVRDDELPPTARDAARGILALRLGPTFCYLAFHGAGGAAQYLKVGVSRHPEQRLYGMATGNPLDCLWAFVCRVEHGRVARRIEARILAHLADHKRRGEWLETGQTDKAGAEALARQLSQFAKDIDSSAGDFEPLEYRDGR